MIENLAITETVLARLLQGGQISPISAGLPLLAVLLSLYSIYRNRDLRKQFERKEKLGELADKIATLEERLERFQSLIGDPTAERDFSIILFQISRETLAFEHTSDQLPKFVLKYGVRDTELDDNLDVFGEEDSPTDYLKGGGNMWPDFRIEQSEESHLGNALDLNFPFALIGDAYSVIDELEEEHGELVEEFDPGFLSELESHLDAIVSGMFRSAHYATVEVDPDEFEDADEIGLFVFKELFYYDGISEDLDGLTDQRDDLNELRQLVLQTSYS